MSALFNCNNYTTALDIYCSMVNGKEDVNEDDGNASTEYGKELEPLLISIVKANFKDKFVVKPFKKYAFYRKLSNPICVASLDGTMVDINTKEKWILEIKTHDVRSNVDLAEWDNHLPQNYFIQCLSYLNVLNDFVGAYLVGKLRWVDYDTGLVIKEEIRYYKLERKDYEKDIELLNKVAKDFDENHLKKRIPPKVDIEIMGKEVSE